jgi:hypothetical protein
MLLVSQHVRLRPLQYVLVQVVLVLVQQVVVDTLVVVVVMVSLDQALGNSVISDQKIAISIILSHVLQVVKSRDSPIQGLTQSSISG